MLAKYCFEPAIYKSQGFMMFAGRSTFAREMSLGCSILTWMLPMIGVYGENEDNYLKKMIKRNLSTPEAVEAVKSAQRREGMILDDPDSINAMTLRYTPVYSARTPDKIPDNKRKFMFDEQGWQDIMSTVEGSVTRVADGIRGGVMDATPKEHKGKTPCDFCEFKPICRRG
jgi:ATP-dependent helicase/DNAse subunit B